jgi:hypothetical protein
MFLACPHLKPLICTDFHGFFFSIFVSVLSVASVTKKKELQGKI